MATSVRTAVADRLGKSGTLSLKKDVFCIYSNDNPAPPVRSLLHQMELIKTKPLVRVAQVTITGSPSPTPAPQLDLDHANEIYQRECGAWVYCVGNITVNRPDLTILDQDDCLLSVKDHSVSDEEDQLYDLGRDLGAKFVCYYILGSNLQNVGGCSGHPPGRRGFWLGKNPASPDAAFAHELTHNVGHNPHVSSPASNLMKPGPGKLASSSTLTDEQCQRILADPDMEYP
jgi:hypothetical protein